MSGDPTQQLLAALHALYHNEDASVKDQANKWLEQWQTTSDAWTVADRVLHDPGSAMEAQYFCAQTLRTKASEPLPSRLIEPVAMPTFGCRMCYAGAAGL